MLEITLDGPPLAKQRVKHSDTHVYTPEKTVTYEGRLAWAAQQAMGARALFTGPLRVTVTARLPVAKSWPKKRQQAALAGIERPTRKPDADNIAKMLDALNFIVWRDDSQVVELFVFKWYTDRPRLRLLVEEIGPNDKNITS